LRVPQKTLGDRQTYRQTAPDRAAYSADNLRKESSVAGGSAEHYVQVMEVLLT
jgi:hypothetical protein